MRKSFILLVFLVCACAPRIYVEPPTEMPPPREIKNVNVALVLGAGGSRGLAHLGVIEVLEENGIKVDLIVGISAGSIVGALYADYQHAAMLKETLIGLRKWDLLDVSILDSVAAFGSLKGPVQGYYLEEFMVKNASVHNIEDLGIPFIAVASSLNSEEIVEISSGPIATAVHASSSIPPIFSPVQAYGHTLVDGGVIEPVAVSVARKYNPKLVIAVDISTIGQDVSLNNMLDVTYKSMYLSYYRLSEMQSMQADIRIHPNLEGYGIFDDGGGERLYQLGRHETIKMMPEILEKMRKLKLK